MAEKAKRYNKGKLRYELLPGLPLKHLVEVYTRGAHKYSVYEDSEGKQVLGMNIPLDQVGKYTLIEDASSNWCKGLSWMETLGAVQRHIEAFKRGEELDPELQTRHLANAAWGLFSLMEYEKTHPEMDDRPHLYLQGKRIALDLDEVLVNFTKGWGELYNEDIRPESWNYDVKMGERLESMKKEGTLDSFYLNLESKISPNDIPFEPVLYLTSRPVDTEITKQWLVKHKFPIKKIITVPVGQSKVAALKQENIDILIDDGFHNFVEANKAGILCLLLDAPHNRRYDVGYKRIKDFNDFKERFL